MMSNPVDDLITAHYVAHVMGKGDPNQVVQDFIASDLNDETRAEINQRLAMVDAMASQHGAAHSERDFCGYIERICLRKVLGLEGNP